MKATVELSDLLFEQAKVAARVRGITLKALTELDRRVAIHPGHAEDVAAFEFGYKTHELITPSAACSAASAARIPESSVSNVPR